MTAPESYAGNTQGDPDWEEYMHTADARPRGARAGEGRHARSRRVVRAPVLGARRHTQPPSDRLCRRHQRELFRQPGGRKRVDRWSLQPAGHADTADTPSRRKIFSCRPKDRASEEPCATQILSDAGAPGVSASRDGKRMSRRCWAFTERPRARAASRRAFSEGSERILAAPSFLFRVERAAGRHLREHRIASPIWNWRRGISFFLWSSIPDDELLDLAARGKLQDPAVVEQQVRRMLAIRARMRSSTISPPSG